MIQPQQLSIISYFEENYHLTGSVNRLEVEDWKWITSLNLLESKVQEMICLLPPSIITALSTKLLSGKQWLHNFFSKSVWSPGFLPKQISHTYPLHPSPAPSPHQYSLIFNFNPTNIQIRKLNSSKFFVKVYSPNYPYSATQSILKWLKINDRHLNYQIGICIEIKTRASNIYIVVCIKRVI